jgi:hypothetical protein
MFEHASAGNPLASNGLQSPIELSTTPVLWKILNGKLKTLGIGRNNCRRQRLMLGRFNDGTK